MDFFFTESQEMIRRAARDFLEQECPKSLVREMEGDEKGYPSELWRKMAELGWMGLPFPERYGGGGGSFMDLIVLLEEMGRACLPSPFVSTVIAGGLTILDIGSDEQAEEFLPAIAKGNRICTVALIEPGNSYDPAAIACRALPDGDGYIITGKKLFVADAHIADYLLVAARAEDKGKVEPGITLFLVDSKSQGIDYASLKTIAADKQFEVNFNDVKVARARILGRVGRSWDGVKRLLERSAIAKCAEMVGGAQRVLEMTIDYSKKRKQFGHPIGSFQVIQHYCVNMAIDLDASRLNTYQAAWVIGEGLPCSKEVAVAKAWVSEACRRIAASGHQIHGAIAFTKELDLELYLRRAKAAEIAFGDADFHREVIARELQL